MTSAQEAGNVPLRIWDLPTRLFHWALVGCLAFAWWSAEQRMLDWHRLAGYGILALLLFRLVWGIIGSATSRFSSFVGGPSAVLGYMRKSMFSRIPASGAGHNPVGGWSVVVMLAVLLTQVALGMFAVDVDGLESGPFSYLVDFDQGRVAAEWHEVVFNIILAISVIHVLAILFYLVRKRENLIGPMFSGKRRWTGQTPALQFASSWKAAVVLALVCSAIWFVIANFGQA